MQADFLDHLRHNWPLTLAALLLSVYLPIVLASGTLYSNQGSIRRNADPSRYWRWVSGLFSLLLVSWAVLIASFVLRA
jgi:hypothetical protein